MSLKQTFTYDAQVVKVIDGDTVDLLVDLGFHTSLSIRTRLLGIDAPEVSTVSGKIAREELRIYLPVGSSVVVRTSKDPEDKYGRWIAQIEWKGGSISDWMIANHHALPWDGNGAKPK